MADRPPVWDHVRGLVPTSLCDWPGKITCVLFTVGCNLRCPTCHNALLAWKGQHLPCLDREVVFGDLRRRKRWLDGLTVSGGEPTLVPALDTLLADLGSLGLPIKLDSNGTNPDLLAWLLDRNLVHSLAVDVKGPWPMYPELTGGFPAAQAQDSLLRIFDLARQYPGRVFFRCTKVSALTPAALEETRGQVPPDLPLLFQEFVPPKDDDLSFSHQTWSSYAQADCKT